MFKNKIMKPERRKRLADYLAAICLAIVCSFPAIAAEPAEPQARDKASDGAFTGLAFVTGDLKWFEQFQRPEAPTINGKNHFSPGESGAIATLFSNAKSTNGRVRVACEITAFDPDGTSRSFPPGMCYDGPAFPPNTLYPSLMDINFTITKEDTYGLAGFKILMRDLNADKSVQLQVSFIQGETQ